MTDPIADIIRKALCDNNEALFNEQMPSMALAPEAAKHIRQQIGRELIEARLNNTDKSNSEIICEVCKLENQE